MSKTKGNLLSKECLEVYASNIIGGQWSLPVCYSLMSGKLRFSELKRCLPNITERMLTLELRRLEEHKIVKRTVYAEVLPRAEYELTPIGYALKPVIKALENWGKKHKAL